MPIAVEAKSVRLISVHDQPDVLRLELPSVTPGTYFIPGISAPEEEFKRCVFSFPNHPPVQYARLRELDGVKYVEIEVFEGRTPQYGTELDMNSDEYGRKMEPPLRRAMLTVTAEDVANELERQSVFFDQNFGVRALSREVTIEDLRAAEKDNLKYLRRLVTETSRHIKFGLGNITEQAKGAAWKLHKLNLLNPLPDWASANPEGGASTDTFNCLGCGTVIPKTIVKCLHPGCGAIYNWKMALELGMVFPKDVPKSKRAEAGLEPLPPGKAEILQSVREKVAEDFAENRI